MTGDTQMGAVRNIVSVANLIAKWIMHASCLVRIGDLPARGCEPRFALNIPWTFPGHSPKSSRLRADRDGLIAGLGLLPLGRVSAACVLRGSKELELNVFKPCDHERACLKSL
jgi:hypothetical protein